MYINITSVHTYTQLDAIACAWCITSNWLIKQISKLPVQ